MSLEWCWLRMALIRRSRCGERIFPLVLCKCHSSRALARSLRWCRRCVGVAVLKDQEENKCQGPPKPPVHVPSKSFVDELPPKQTQIQKSKGAVRSRNAIKGSKGEQTHRIKSTDVVQAQKESQKHQPA